MNDLLNRIVARKFQEVAARDPGVAPAGRAGRFRAGLAKSPRRPALIAEVKRRSPSHGAVWESFDPVAIAQAYERAGAAAISVLTDEEFFGGSLEDLKRVKASVELPVLRKDFVVDASQIHEAALAGADAVLLIVRLMEQSKLAEFVHLAASVGLDALVEVHTPEEAKRALDAGAEIVGVNHRDLDTLEMNLGLSETVLPTLAGTVLRVSESGLYSADDVERVARAGADAVLIGAALSTTEGIEARLAEVMGWPR